MTSKRCDVSACDIHLYIGRAPASELARALLVLRNYLLLLAAVCVSATTKDDDEEKEQPPDVV